MGPRAGDREVKCFSPFLIVGTSRADHRLEADLPGWQELYVARKWGERGHGCLAGGREARIGWALCGCGLCSSPCQHSERATQREEGGAVAPFLLQCTACSSVPMTCTSDSCYSGLLQPKSPGAMSSHCSFVSPQDFLPSNSRAESP